MYLELTEWAIPHPTLLSNTELLVNSLQIGTESQRHWFEELLDIARNPVKKHKLEAIMYMQRTWRGKKEKREKEKRNKNKGE